MAGPANALSQADAPPLTGTIPSGGPIDPEGLSTVHEVPHHHAIDPERGTMDGRRPSKALPLNTSRDASLRSSTGQSYDEKQSYSSAHGLPHTTSTKSARHGRQHNEEPRTSLPNGNGYHRDGGPARLTKPTPRKREKRGGFRNTLRRMFGRRSTMDRTSVPNPAVYPRHVSFVSK